MQPGKIENWVTIIDLKGIGLTQVPKKMLKAIIQPMQSYFKGRLFRMYIINAHWTLQAIWKIAKKMIDPLTLLKFKVLGETISKELHELIDADKLEKRYGGNLADKTENFFPPDLL